jgi:hypothetical protein
MGSGMGVYRRAGGVRDGVQGVAGSGFGAVEGKRTRFVVDASFLFLLSTVAAGEHWQGGRACAERDNSEGEAPDGGGASGPGTRLRPGTSSSKSTRHIRDPNWYFPLLHQSADAEVPLRSFCLCRSIIPSRTVAVPEFGGLDDHNEPSVQDDSPKVPHRQTGSIHGSPMGAFRACSRGGEYGPSRPLVSPALSVLSPGKSRSVGPSHPDALVPVMLPRLGLALHAF